MCMYIYIKTRLGAVQGTVAASIDQQTRAVKSLIFGISFFPTPPFTTNILLLLLLYERPIMIRE